MPPNATVSDENLSDRLAALAAAYGLIDGFNAASSTLRLIFDVMYQNNSRLSIIAMREWMLTQEGMLVVIAETLFLMGISFLSNQFPTPEEGSAFKHYIFDVWEFLRPMLKALKNSYKGIRSLVQAIDLMLGQHSTYLIIPIWIVVGVLSGLNRNWYSGLAKARKKIIKANEALLQEVRKDTSNEYSMLLQNIKEEGSWARLRGFISKIFGGIIDGLYLYMGAAVVVAFTPAFFAVVMLFSAIFALTCIATRIYEEYNLQRQVFVSVDRVKLEIDVKRLSVSFADMQRHLKFMDEANDCDRDQLEQEFQRLLEAFQLAVDRFLRSRRMLRSRLIRSDGEAILAGLTHGLAIYGAISALMFSAYTIMLMLAFSLPPIVVLICVSIGMLSLIGLSINAYVHNIFIVHQIHQADAEQDKKLIDIYNCLKEEKNVLASLQLELDLIPDSQDSNSILFNTEVCRSGFSGIGKSPKAIEFIFCSLQHTDENGRNHDTPVMFLLTALCAILYTSVLGLSAYHNINDPKNRKKTVIPGNGWCGFFRDAFFTDLRALPFLPSCLVN